MLLNGALVRSRVLKDPPQLLWVDLFVCGITILRKTMGPD